VTRVCEECGGPLESQRSTAQFCTDTCGARNRRRRKREETPIKETRTFICKSCGETWKTAAKGRFKWCPACREARDLEGRTKVCGYRECGREFVDTTPRKVMSYCHPEHRRREKQFRSGKVQDASQFLKPDPVLR